MRIFGLIVSAAVLTAGFASVADAALTAEQRKELSALRKELTGVSTLLRKKQYDEAGKALDDVEKKLGEIAKGNEKDRSVLAVQRLLTLRRNSLNKVTGKGGVSFQKHVATILKAKCVRCHSGDRPRGGLKLDTFAGMVKGGQNGALVYVGNPNRSLLTLKLIAQGNARMPKGGAPLSATEIRTIAAWIQQGAKFDGKDRNAPIGEDPGMKTAGAKPKTAVKITYATGNEKVSFVKDIAPFMANLCLNCHNDRRKRSGFSLETFEKLMIGGDSGRVVLPGNLDGSRLWDLVGKQQPIKMPQGQALITRKNHSDLRIWIEEGAKFDGNNPKATLRSLVPTEAETRAAELAKLSPAEFAQHRLKKTEEQWKRVAPKERARYVESDNFFVYGNASQTRLQEIDKWAEAHARELAKLFGEKAKPMFKGKLAVFVFKDRFGYTEFNQVINNRQTPQEMTGHSLVETNFDDAYVVLQDVGDTVSADSPGMQLNLIENLTAAYMQRGGGKLPAWVMRGTGLALAARADAKNEYILAAKGRVPDMLKSLGKAEDVFADGTFSPANVGIVGYTLVDFMLRGGGPAKFGRFVTMVQRGSKVDAAIKAVYQADIRAMAGAYYNSFRRKR